ncbi:MAG: fibronectin type III domain-containing protein, partial [Candidatus Wildermuthbacteria bacterium]|nr:fibronectin type III domain-containing protein [Candidatus Wildermuthbacteria bacterium]
MGANIYKQVFKNRYLLAIFFILLFALAGGYAIYRTTFSYAAVATIDKQVVLNSDDAYHVTAGWPNYSDADGVVYAGAPENGPAVGGWRWTGLSIPAGATITNAYAELNQTGYGHAVTTTLALEKTASPATFSAISSPATRWGNKTTFQTSFAWVSNTPNSWIKTSSLTAGIQELVDAYGAIDSVVLLEDGAGVTLGQYHEWASYDGNVAFAAKLHIEYSTGGTVTVPTPTPVQATPTPSSSTQPTPTPAQTSPAPTSSVAPSSGNWPEKVDLATNESRTITLRDGTTRTLRLVSYNILVPRQKIEATIEVSGNGKVEQHTLRVAFDGVPVSVNGLRVYGYAWKEADDSDFEEVISSAFPLTAGKAVGFGVSDAKYTFFPDMNAYTWPLDIAFNEGGYLQTWLEKDGWAHGGYDVGTRSNSKLKALMDGYVFHFPNDATQGQMLISKNSNWGSFPEWVATHVLNNAPVYPNGTFVTKGTVIANGFFSDHAHFSSRGHLDFGAWLFLAEVWNYERQNSFPAPRHWLVLGPYSDNMAGAHISPSESGDIPNTVLPQKGAFDKDNSAKWKFADNFVSGITRMAQLISDVPFSDANIIEGQYANSLGYAATYIYSPSDHTADNAVHLKWGINGSAKIWLNGSSIQSVTENSLVIDQYDYVLPLKKGWNTLIIKTKGNGNVPWAFSPKIGDANGNRISDLIFSARDIYLWAVNIGNTSIGLSWSHPNYHGTFVSSYKVDVATDAAFSNIVKTDNVSNTSTSHTITGLATGTQYYVRVRPYNDYEMGGSTYWQHYDSIIATTGGTVVPTPTPTTSTQPTPVPTPVVLSTLPSQSPPAGIAVNRAPQFVLIGSDDNHQVNGMAFFRQLLQGKRNPAGTGNAATFDGLPMTMSFYLIGTNIYGENIDSITQR